MEKRSGAAFQRVCSSEMPSSRARNRSGVPSSCETPGKLSIFRSSYRTFAAIDADGVAGHPIRVLVTEHRDAFRDVLSRGEPVMRIALESVLHEPLVARNLAQSGSVGDAGANGVGRNAKRRQLECELADLRFENRLRGAYRAIMRHRFGAP